MKIKTCTNGQAPSERELSFAKQKTEGECVNSQFNQKIISAAGSFHHFVVPLPLGGRLATF